MNYLENMRSLLTPPSSAKRLIWGIWTNILHPLTPLLAYVIYLLYLSLKLNNEGKHPLLSLNDQLSAEQT